jgi:CheY-like chemotaxis protein
VNEDTFVAMKIVILEDNKDRQAVMRACLADRFHQYDIRLFDNPAETIRFLEDHLSDTLVISLDHDLELIPGPNGSCIDPGTGREVADFLSEREPACPVILHTTNARAADGMESALREAGWKVRRVVPFDDMNWIETDWFTAIRRAIVGPVRDKPPTGSLT